MELKKMISEHREKKGALGGSAGGIVGVMMVFNTMMVDFPKKNDLTQMELRITKEIGVVEKAMNDSAQAYIEQLVSTRTALFNHISTDKAGFDTLLRDFKAHQKIPAHPEAKAKLNMIMRKLEK